MLDNSITLYRRGIDNIDANQVVEAINLMDKAREMIDELDISAVPGR